MIIFLHLAWAAGSPRHLNKIILSKLPRVTMVLVISNKARLVGHRDDNNTDGNHVTIFINDIFRTGHGYCLVHGNT